MKKILGLNKLTRNRFFLPGVIIAFLLGLFLMLSSEVQEAAAGQPELIVGVDGFLLNFFASLRNPWLNAVAVDITALGSTTVLTLLTTVFVLFMLMLKRKELAIHLIVASTGAGLISKTMKAFFGRDRPSIVEKLVFVQGHSYPSGHSLASAAVYLTLALLSYELLQKTAHKGLVFLVAAFIVVLIGLSRIYLGVHYPTDVAGGILVGTSWALGLTALNSTLQTRKKTRVGASK